MNDVKLGMRLAGAESAGQFKVLKRVAAARATPALVASFARVFDTAARAAADRDTRRWFANQRGAVADGDIADLTLAYYESALRKFRPYLELDYACAGEERTCRYRGGDAFLRWLGRQRRIKPRVFRVFFAVPATRVQVQLQPCITADKSFLWAAGVEPAALEDLVAALDAALAQEAGPRRRLRSWLVNILLAGALALPFAVGLTLRLRHLAWHTVLAAATAADAASVLGLVYLFRLAFPAVVLAFDANAGARWRRRAWRAAYGAAALALLAGAAVLIFTSFFRLAW